MRRRGWCAFLGLALLAAACGGGGNGDGSAGGSDGGYRGGPIRIGIWGDTPYSGIEATGVSRLVDEMNRAKLDITIFVGDLFGATCENRDYLAAADNLKAFVSPLVYVPGDNEWTDCHVTAKDPLERLAYVRRMFFPTSNSFGERRLKLDQQRPDYPENSRWLIGDVVFVSLNVAGSNNNHIADPDAEETGTPRSPADRRAAEAEFRARDQATRAWLKEAFGIARERNSPAIVVAMHADPGFGVPIDERRERRLDGFDFILTDLAAEARSFAKPVLLVHGDSHRFVHDTPLRDLLTGEPVPNVTRVETYGSPDVGWVEIVLDPANPSTPVVTPHLVQPA